MKHVKDMCTFVKSASILWSGLHSRWLFPLEAFSCQGIPIDTTYTHGKACSSLAARSSGLVDTPWPSRSACFQMTGNAMHSGVVGAILMYAISEVKISLFVRDCRGPVRGLSVSLPSDSESDNEA